MPIYMLIYLYLIFRAYLYAYLYICVIKLIYVSIITGLHNCMSVYFGSLALEV